MVPAYCWKYSSNRVDFHIDEGYWEKVYFRLMSFITSSGVLNNVPLSLNVAKSSVMVFSHIPDLTIDLQLNSIFLRNVSSNKYLGVFYYQKLNLHTDTRF